MIVAHLSPAHACPPPAPRVPRARAAASAGGCVRAQDLAAGLPGWEPCVLPAARAATVAAASPGTGVDA